MPLYLPEEAAPELPPGSRVALYAKTDSLLYWKDAAGTERPVASNASGASAAWPIGSIFMNITATGPATLLGIGTWARFGEGRILVSQKSSDTDFDVAEETGGAKTHTQIEAELATHTHVQNSHNHTQDAHNHTQDSHNHTQNQHQHSQDANTFRLNSGVNFTTTAGTTGGAGGTTSMETPTNQAATATNQAATATNQAATATNQNTGSGTAMNIMNPYIVVYMWKRTA